MREKRLSTADLGRVTRDIQALRADVRRLSPGGEGSPGSGVSGFSIDSTGDLILTYAGAAPDVSIDGNGNLILEV